MFLLSVDILHKVFVIDVFSIENFCYRYIFYYILNLKIAVRGVFPTIRASVTEVIKNLLLGDMKESIMQKLVDRSICYSY